MSKVYVVVGEISSDRKCPAFAAPYEAWTEQEPAQKSADDLSGSQGYKYVVLECELKRTPDEYCDVCPHALYLHDEDGRCGCGQDCAAVSQHATSTFIRVSRDFLPLLDRLRGKTSRSKYVERLVREKNDLDQDAA